mgnify:CR=1 FL=1
MQREIKFRAWIEETKTMENGLFGLRSDGKTSFNKDCILMQYTGVKDVNEKEVYEGDIVKRMVLDGKEIKDVHIGIIKWDNCNFYSHSIKNELSRGFCKMQNVEYVILGNIFQSKKTYEFENDINIHF